MDQATSNAVLAVAAVLTVVITAVYAVFTILLWRATRRQAQLAAQSAAQTREMFEATHRPWVSIEPFQLYAFTDSQVRLEFRLRNHGPSPAFVTRWVRHWGLDSSDRPPLTADRGEHVAWCVLPGGTADALEIKWGDPHGVWQRGNRFEVGALYQGADGHLRRTRLLATLRVKGEDTFDLDGVKHEAD
jgi:hypothetical protein